MDASLRFHLLLQHKQSLKRAYWLLDKGIGSDASDAWLHAVANSFYFKAKFSLPAKTYTMAMMFFSER